MSRAVPSGARRDERRGIRARAAARTQQPAAADSTTTTPKPRRQNWSSPPTPPTPPRSHYSSSPALPAFLLRRPEQLTPTPLTHLIPHLPNPDPPCRRPAPRHSSFPPGLARPGFTWTVEEGESGAKRRTPLPPTAQAGRQRNTQRRGGGLLRSRKKPIERNRWRETQGRETGVSSTPASLRRLRLCRCSTTPPAMAPSVAGGAGFRSSRSARVPLAQETPEKPIALRNPGDGNVSEAFQKPLDRLRTARLCSTR